MLGILGDRLVRRWFEYQGDFDFANQTRYQVAAEDFAKGVVNNPPCDACTRGVAVLRRPLDHLLGRGETEKSRSSGTIYKSTDCSLTRHR